MKINTTNSGVNAGVLAEVAATITAAAISNPSQQGEIAIRIAALTKADAPEAFATVAAQYYRAVFDKLMESLAAYWEEEPDFPRAERTHSGATD